MNVFTQALSAALVQFLWQGAAVGVSLWMVRLALRHRSANARYVASCFALAVLVAIPVISAAALYRDPLPVVTAAVTVTRARAVAVPTERFLPIWVAADTPRLAWLAALQTWALPVWSIGVLLFSVRLACGCARLATIRRCAGPADASVLEIVARLSIRMAVHRPVRLLISMGVDGPAVVGWLRPMILLPPSALLGLTPQQLEAVLAHEMAHIRRHDYFVNLLQTLAETLLFYHPVVWWTSRQLRLEREWCCDDLAVASSGDVATYARALTTLERLRVVTPAAAVGATSGSLIERVQRLLGTRTPEYRRSPWAGGLALVVAIGCVALNASWWQVLAQSNNTPRFEVASIKPTKPGTRGFGTPGVPGRFTVAQLPDETLSRAAQDALGKINSVLPTALRERAELSGLFPVPRFEVARDSIDAAVLRAAIRDERKLRLAYRNDEGRYTTRVVWPLAIGFYDRLRILVAWCELRTDFRHFRTDRIESADRLDAPLPRSRHDLLREWRAQEAAAEPPV